MSNHTREEEFIPEPDENVLMSALRNQDDIPILMDVVGESLAPKISQAGHLSQVLAQGAESETDLDLPTKKEELIAASSTAAVSVTEPTPSNDNLTSSIEPERLQQAIEKAFAKLLPSLVEAVVNELEQSDTTKKL